MRTEFVKPCKINPRMAVGIVRRAGMATTRTEFVKLCKIDPQMATEIVRQTGMESEGTIHASGGVALRDRMSIYRRGRWSGLIHSVRSQSLSQSALR